MSMARILTVGVAVAQLLATAQIAHGQAYGVELRASLMPASGGMGGTSVARPQDLQSALMNNPATLTFMTNA